MDRKKFFAAVQSSVFGGFLTTPQVVVIEHLLAAYKVYTAAVQRHVAE